MSSLKTATTSIRLPPELWQRLEETARRLGRGKNWIVVRALEQYLAKGDDRAFAQEARANLDGPARGDAGRGVLGGGHRDHGLARMRRGDIVIAVTPGDDGKPRPAAVVQSDLICQRGSSSLSP